MIPSAIESFHKSIVLDKFNSMCIKLYNYRVEFQLMGAGHIHEVLWIDLDQTEILIPGISSALTALRVHQHLNEEQFM